MSKEPSSFKQFLARKNVVFSAKRYGIDALGAMAQGLFASLLMGTILSTLGQQIGFELLVTIGDYAKGKVWGNNLVFCALAGVLWLSLIHI